MVKEGAFNGARVEKQRGDGKVEGSEVHYLTQGEVAGNCAGACVFVPRRYEKKYKKQNRCLPPAG